MGRIVGLRGPLVDSRVGEMDHLDPNGSVEEQLVLGAFRGNGARTVAAYRIWPIQAG